MIERRTLRGISAPFRLYGTFGEGGRFYPSRDSKKPTGELVEIKSVKISAGVIYGTIGENARVFTIGGTATKLWVEI